MCMPDDLLHCVTPGAEASLLPDTCNALLRALSAVDDWCDTAAVPSARLTAAKELSKFYTSALFFFISSSAEDERQRALLIAISEQCADVAVHLSTGQALGGDVRSQCTYWMSIAGKLLRLREENPTAAPAMAASA